MAIDDVFAKINAHMIEGIMFHDKMSEYFAFLNLCGYEEMHKEHSLCEFVTHKNIVDYYIQHYNKLIANYEIDNITVIPDSWRSHIKQDVDANTKQRAVKESFEKWQNWEKQTLKLYEQAYSELTASGEIAAANQIHNLILDVETELSYAEKCLIDLASVNYDMNTILAQQIKTG